MKKSLEITGLALHVELELELDSEPPRGLVRSRDGAERAFTGWLGFAEALNSLREREATTGAAGSERERKEAAMSDRDQEQDRPILVLGATGKTGRRVAARLAARGIPTRLGSRGAEPAFDWEDPASWPAVIDGARSAYISYYPDLAIPGAKETVGAFAELAVERGLRRLVLLAGRGEREAEEAEDAVRASGAELTVLRATWFAQNFSEDYMRDGVLDGGIYLPAGSVPEPFVDADDIADVAVAALTEPGHVGETYVLTGPRALTFAEVAAEIAAAIGRPVEFVPITVEEFKASALEQGVPADVVSLLEYLFSEVLDGRNTPVEDGVERALGRPPRDFSQYARQAAASGAWNLETPAAA
jgi:uncharacterized protein YbjT (DUF2867 family)